MVRVTRFQLSLSLKGKTGWMLVTAKVSLSGPQSKSILLWIGRLIMLAIGFWAFLASAAAELSWAMPRSSAAAVFSWAIVTFVAVRTSTPNNSFSNIFISLFLHHVASVVSHVYCR